MARLNQQFPSLSAPVVDPTGLVTQEWQQFFRTLWARTGSAVGSQTILTGMIIAYAGEEIPDGFLLCDGREVPRQGYPLLFRLIGEKFGVASRRALFVLPDYRDRSILGAGAENAFGTSGGVSSVILSVANLAEHTHDLSDLGHAHSLTLPDHTHAITDPGHVHTGGAVSAAIAGTLASGADSAATDSAVTGITVNAGGGGAFNTASTVTGLSLVPVGENEAFSVQNPFVAVNILIKT